MKQKKDSKIDDLFEEYLINLQEEFPATKELAAEARRINDLYFNLNNSKIMSNPDTSILSWVDTEYELFKYIENHRYKNKITKAFNNVDEFIKFANTVLNRRKSRAGKSLEHHLSSMFRIFEFNFSEQPKTENNKKPDFIFPSEFAYHDTNFNANKLIFLASKTTCKDRWRQILNEADRIKIKYLFTLQRGISINQLNEMYSNNVRLVVPKPYISEYPKEFRNQIFTFQKFIEKNKRTSRMKFFFII